MAANDPPFVIHVRRRNCRLNYKITIWEMISTDVYGMAWRVAKDFIHVQNQKPEMGVLIDESGHRELALKLPERDRPLAGFLTLRTALEGQWKEMDAMEIGEDRGGLSPDMSRARVVILDLIEYRR